MTKIAHTPGRLVVNHRPFEGHYDLDSPHETLAQVNYVDNEPGGRGLADAERLRDCWNALEGIPNPDVVPEAIAALRGVRWRSADRDNMEFVATITYSQMDKLRAILAKLEGRP